MKMNNSKTALCVVSALALGACATDTNVKVVSTQQLVPENLIQLVEAPEPPTEEEYNEMNFTEKEFALFRHISALNRALVQANDQFQALQEYNVSLRKVNEADTKKE